MEAVSLGAGLSDAIPAAGHSGSVLAVFTLRLPKSLGQWQRRKLPFQPQVAFETVQQGVPLKVLPPTRLVFASASRHLGARWYTNWFPVDRFDQARSGHQRYPFSATPGAAKCRKDTTYVRGWTPILQPLVTHVFLPLSSKTGSRSVLS